MVLYEREALLVLLVTPGVSVIHYRHDTKITSTFPTCISPKCYSGVKMYRNVSVYQNSVIKSGLS